MRATYRSEKSLRGYTLDVLKSALQKYVRRGDFERAKFALAELDLFSLAAKESPRDSKRIRTNMIHRLMIIFLEDIGLGGIELWPRIDKLLTLWLRERDGPESVGWLQEILWLMCFSNKTRICSHVRAAMTAKDSLDHLKTLLGCCYLELARLAKGKWRNIFAFFALNKAEMEELALAARGSVQARWFKELKGTRESFLCLLLPLLKRDLPATHFPLPFAVRPENVPVFCGAKWDVEAPRIEFDDFVFDKHCRGSGETSEKTREYFVHVSSFVNNEVYPTTPLFKQIYQGVARETQAFELITRCQLVCSASKTDSYIAKQRGKLLFVKGPYKEPPMFFVQMQAIKRAYNLPSIQARVDYLYADRWPEGTPLGVRNSLARDIPLPFLVCDSLLEEKELVTKMAESKLWPQTKVLDFSRIPSARFDPFSLSEQELADYVGAVKLRARYNIGDFADRNFVRAGGRVYSVDEEYGREPINLEKQLKKKRYELVTNHPSWNESC